MNKKLPSGLYVEKWFTEEKDLPHEFTHDFFMVKVREKETKDEFYTLAMFLYDPVRKRIDFDGWRFAEGGKVYARFSSENEYEVIAWGRLKVNKDE